MISNWIKISSSIPIQQGYGVEDAQDEYRNESYICYLNEQLGPYCEYVLWGDPANVDATRTLYAKRTPFPFNFSHPQKYMKRAQDLLQIYGAFNITEKLEHHHTADLVIKAKIFVNTLSERLTHREWFFDGTKPTQFDAAVYAKLAIMYNMQLQNNDLKSHINECPSLVKFMKAVRGKYLFDIKVNGGNGAEQKTITSRVKRVFVDSESGSLSNGTVKVIAGIVAISSMVIFALTHGILEIGTDDDSSATGQYTPYDDDDEYGDE